MTDTLPSNETAFNQSTLTDLLEQSGLTFHWLNAMRGIHSISHTKFKQIERGKQPYPYPVARAAWFTLLIHDDDGGQNHSIWFLKLNLDEQGLIPPTQRDLLIAEFLDTLGLAENKKITRGEASAFSWQPNDEQKAAIHAKSTRLFAEPPSQWYLPVLDYIKKTSSTDGWQSLGLQGFADLASRLDQKNGESLLTEHLKKAHPVVFESFSSYLQNNKTQHKLCKVVADRLLAAPVDATPTRFYLKGIQAFGQTSARGMAVDCILRLLKTRLGEDQAFLTQIALCNWTLLENEELGAAYLDKLIDTDSSGQLFQTLVADMIFVPGFRVSLMTLFRAESRSDKLAVAVGQLFNQA